MLMGEGNNIRGYHLFLVQSGSMEPSIMTGDVIIVKSDLNYKKLNVVTFKDSQNRIVTHRIIDIKDDLFITKGDANRSVDNGTTHFNKVIGKVVFILPKLGFLVVFSKSLPGLMIFILIPATLIFVGELLKNVKKSK